MESVLSSFVRSQERRGLSRKTVGWRTRNLSRFADYLAARGKHLQTATREDIEEWLDSCDLSPRSRGTYLSAVRAFYDWCVDEEKIDASPAARIRRPKPGKLMPHPTNHADLEVALEHADPRMRAWLTLAAYDGLRCIELANLRREDIREDAEPPVLIVHGKGDKQRVLPLNERAELALRLYGLPASGYLFRRRDGARLSESTIGSYIGAYLHGLGIRSNAHSLRHRFATSVWTETRDILAVRELMGHEDVRTSMVYMQFDPGESTSVVRHLGGRTYGRRRGHLLGEPRPEHGGTAGEAPVVGVAGEPVCFECRLPGFDDLYPPEPQRRRVDVVPPVADDEDGSDVADLSA